MKTFIFSIFVFSETLSNLIGSSLRMRCPCLLCLRISRTTSFIFLMQVPTSSRGTLFVPAKTTTASSFLDTIPDRRLLMPSAVDPGHGKQQAETPVDLSDTSLPWPLTMDAPTILIITSVMTERNGGICNSTV